MKALAIIENSQSVDACREYFMPRMQDYEAIVIVDLDPIKTYAGFNQKPFQIKQETDYLSGDSFENIMHQAYTDVRCALQHPDLSHLFYYRNIPINEIIIPAMERSFFTVYKYILLLEQILIRETFTEIILFDEKHTSDNQDASNRNPFSFADDEALMNRILQYCVAQHDDLFFLKSKQVTNLSVDYVAEHRETNAASIAFKNCARKVSALFSMVLSGVTARSYKINKPPGIVLVGAPRIMFPFFEGHKKQRQNQLIYFQEIFAPRLYARSIRYQNTAYAALYSTPRPPKGEGILFQDFYQQIQKNGLLKLKHICLLSLLCDKFKYKFEYLTGKIMDWIDELHVFFEKYVPRAVILDEDMGFFSRSIIFVAKKLGIKTFEYQHGVIVSYWGQRETVDQKLVWGDFFFKKIQQETDIPKARVSIVGAVHLKYFHDHFSSPKKTLSRIRTLRKEYKIPKDARVVLYAPHPFHHGLKGGIPGVHLTKKEAGETLDAVIHAIKEIPEAFLFIKLHHGDKGYPLYVRRLQELELQGRFAVGLKNEIIYPLLKLCDVFVAPISTAILEASLFKCPTILLDFSKRKARLPYTEYAAVRTVDAANGLTPALRELLDEPDRYQKQTQLGRERILQEMAQGSSETSFKDFFQRVNAGFNQEVFVARE